MTFGASHIRKQRLAPLTTKPIMTFKTIGVFFVLARKKERPDSYRDFFLDLLFLLHQGKRKERINVINYTMKSYLLVADF